MRSQLALAVAAVTVSIAPACDEKSRSAPAPGVEEATQAAPATVLGDLSTSLTEAREAFNAHKDRARFLTLLSPT